MNAAGISGSAIIISTVGHGSQLGKRAAPQPEQGHDAPNVRIWRTERINHYRKTNLLRFFLRKIISAAPPPWPSIAPAVLFESVRVNVV